MATLHIDFETYSRVDLLKCGAYIYMQDESTGVICLAWAFDEEEPELWWPGQPFPERVKAHMEAGARRSIHAHNANFERLGVRHLMIKQFLAKQPPIEAFYCTAAQARSRSLPGALDNLGACLGAKFQKDKRGKELIKLLCIPQADGTFNRDPKLLAEMGEYCLQDVRVERIAASMSAPLTDEEFDDYVANEKVNDVGLMVDVDFARAATQYAEAEMKEISDELGRVSNGQITSPRQYKRIKELMEVYFEKDDRVRKAMTVVKTDRRAGTEVRKIAFDKDARAKLLLLAEDEPELFPDHVIDIIDLCDEAGRSSVAKYDNMVRRADEVGIVRGAYIFAGAGQTGRFSSTGLQVHNMPRKCAKDPELLRDRVMRRDTLDNVMDDLASMLRPSIIAGDGNELVWGDWSAIEARVLPWLSGDLGGEKVLKIFRTNDADASLPDIYKVEYANAYGGDAKDVTKDQRAVGKVIVLSLGYQGGRRALQSMARNYQVVVSDAEAERLVRTWRDANPWAPDFWKELDRAAKDAVRYPGESFTAGRLTYCMPDASAPLYCLLPSGRALSYPQPRLEIVEGRFGPETTLSCIKAQWAPKQGETEWGRVNLYGGLLAENATQGFSACILRRAIKMVQADGWPLVGHTHDELMLEVSEDEVSDARDELHAVMGDVPMWAPGLPLTCEVEHGVRYFK